VILASLSPFTCTLYTDGSFHRATDLSSPFMASTWLALDDNGFILEFSYTSLPSCFRLALWSEIYAVISGLQALFPGSSVTIATDCAQLISLWTQFVDAPFSSKLLRQPNHLLWLPIRRLLVDRALQIKLVKVPAHTDNALNTQVDTLAKKTHTSP
jgi:hypothetical protein